MRLKAGMSSSAGSTRRARYLAAAAAGFALAVSAILVSFWATYYTSPRMQAENRTSLLVEGAASLTLPLPGCTSERVFYSVSVTSSSPVAVSLEFLRDGRVLRSVDLGEGVSVAREGGLLLDEPPSEAALRLRCGSCTTRAVVSVRYSSVDYGYLLALNVVSILSSVTGIALLTVGAYGYVAAGRGGKGGAR